MLRPLRACRVLFDVDVMFVFDFERRWLVTITTDAA